MLCAFAESAFGLVVAGVADEHHLVAASRGNAALRGAPCRPAGRWRRRPAGLSGSASARTAGATPWAEKTTVAPSGTSSSSCTKTAPRSSRSGHDVAVVDDLPADVHGRTEAIESPFDRLDGPFDAGAERPWPGQDHLPRADRGGPLVQHGSSGPQRGEGAPAAPDDGGRQDDRACEVSEMARTTATGVSQGTLSRAAVSMSTAKRPESRPAWRDRAGPFTRCGVDTIGPTLTVSPRRRRAAATSGADVEVEPAPCWPSLDRGRGRPTTTSPGASPSIERACHARHGDGARAWSPRALCWAVRPARRSPAPARTHRGCRRRRTSRPGPRPGAGARRSRRSVRGIRHGRRTAGGPHVAAQGHDGPDQAVEVVVDAEVPGEAGAGEPGLVPGAVRALGVDQPGDAAAGRWRARLPRRPAGPAGPRPSARRWSRPRPRQPLST